jgi:hypothetical protein
MTRRLILGLATALMAFMMTPMAASTAPATSYGFEECAEGWTVTESREEPLDDPGEWKPSPPGNPEGSPLQAFRTQPYPQAAQNGNPEEVSYEAWLTSPVHSFPGASKISFYVKHNIETVPENPVVTGGDFLYVELSTNGGDTWQKKATINGISTGFVKKEVNVPTAGEVQLRFHLYSDNNTSGEGNSGGEIAIDDVVFPAPRPTSATCEGGGGGTKCTKSGNAESNTIRGTDGADRLCCKGGGDKLYGKGGKAVLLGGKGKDTCIGGPGKDTFKSCETKRQ